MGGRFAPDFLIVPEVGQYVEATLDAGALVSVSSS